MVHVHQAMAQLLLQLRQQQRPRQQLVDLGKFRALDSVKHGVLGTMPLGSPPQTLHRPCQQSFEPA